MEQRPFGGGYSQPLEQIHYVEDYARAKISPETVSLIAWYPGFVCPVQNVKWLMKYGLEKNEINLPIQNEI